MTALVWHISNTTEKTTHFQVAIFVWIKELTEYLYQKEVDFPLTSRDK